MAADLHRRGLGLKSLHEDLDTTAPSGQLTFHVLAALTQFRRRLIAERTHEGLAVARSRGIVGGRPTVMTAEKIAAARSLLPDNSVGATARQIGVSRGTLYSHMDVISAKTGRQQSKVTQEEERRRIRTGHAERQ